MRSEPDAFRDLRRRVRLAGPGSAVRLGKTEREIACAEWDRQLAADIESFVRHGSAVLANDIVNRPDEPGVFRGMPIEWTEDETLVEVVKDAD